MPMEKPDAASTPITVPFVKGRKGIREDSAYVQSPIDLEVSRHKYETRSNYRTLESASHHSPQQSPKRSPRMSPKENKVGEPHPANRSGSYDPADSDDIVEDEEGLSSDGDHYEQHNLQDENKENQGKSFEFKVFMSIVGLVFALLAGLYFIDDSSSETPPMDIQERFNFLETEFHKQDVDFWRYIKVSIKEIPILDQPRTIIFLYNNKAERTLNKILKEVSQVALCNLSDCSNKAVEVEGASLNTSEITNDYGKIITKYRDRLEKNGVMIVKNLEKVPGLSAQAFHSYCDDYNPVVKKALILFTLKVDKLPEGYPLAFVEQFLLKLWNDIGKDDKFYPLFTRISGTILPIRPE